MSKIFCNRLFLLFGAIGALFIVIETLLQLTSFIVKLNYSQQTTAINTTGKIVISCIGESTTGFGGNDSYPSQLQELLGLEKFHVVNRGMPGSTTTQILQKIDYYLEIDKPAIVLVMAGINDDSHAHLYGRLGVWENLISVKILSWSLHSFFSQGSQIEERGTKLMDSKIYGHFKRGNYQEYLKHFYQEELSEGISDLSFVDWALKSLLRLGQEREFIALLSKYHLKEPGFISNYIDVINDYLEGKEVIDQQFILSLCSLYEQFIDQLTPYYMRSLMWWYPKILFDYKRNGIEFEPVKLAFDDLFRQIDKKNPVEFSKWKEEMEEFINYNLEISLDRQPSPLFSSLTSRRNLLEIIERIKLKGAIPVVMQYPVRRLSLAKSLYDSSVRYYISNENMRKNPHLFTDFFAGDFGHATKLGNSIIARNAYNFLVGLDL